MKKLHVSSVSILFAALCLAFTACNQGVTAGNGTGTVRVVIGGETARAVDAAGMPVFDEKNTTITVTGEDGTKLAEGTTSVTVEVGIGTKITVKAVVTTAAGVWRGSTEHTVTEGDNPVSVKLSKAPNSVGNILIDVVEQNPKYGQVKFKLAGGKELVSKALISNQEYLVTARDSIGRIYVLYREGSFGSATFHFKRYDTEGNEDAGFEAAITGKLPSGVTLNTIKTMTVDAKTNTIFIVGMDMTGSKHAYAVTEKGHNNFTLSNGFDLTSIGIGNTIQTAAAYNGTLFFTVPSASSGSSGMENKLVAVKAELSGSALTLTKKDEKTLPKLRPRNARNNTNCTGLFADADGVYCLLSDQNLYGGNLYALGQIVRYQYSGSAFTGETKIGLNPKAAGTDGIPFDAQYFSAPVGFIGYDEENIYIADDGYNIEYLNETWRTNGNKNRIAAFNRKTNAITFTDTAATWYEQKPEYKYPNTKILLWEKGDGSTYYGMQYWVADTANTTIPATPADALWFSNQSAVTPTDIFCYDQDGNLYILWRDSSNNYKVRRFALKEDGSYEKAAAQDLNLGTSDTVDAIAVDVSNGKNYLYYYTETPTPTPTPTNKKIERFKWDVSFYSFGSKEHDYNINVLSTEKVTALAANKDGVFVATKETYRESGIDKYRLKVQKYAKTGSLTAPDSEITLVDNAVSYTNTADPPNPIADPSPGHDPDQACHQYQETINGLQIANGMLYGISSKLHRKWLMNVSHVWSPDVFKHSSILYKIGSTTEALPNRPLAKKERPVDDTNKVGYGFYRFIAVKYDEAERIRLIIASDSAWGKGGSGHSPDMANTDTIVEFNLKDMLFREVKRSDNVFSKKLVVSGFDWD